jgi:hypothetical protein
MFILVVIKIRASFINSFREIDKFIKNSCCFFPTEVSKKRKNSNC